MVPEQQRFGRRRLRSDSSGRLELGRALRPAASWFKRFHLLANARAALAVAQSSGAWLDYRRRGNLG
jgi:hypothetical protein